MSERIINNLQVLIDAVEQFPEDQMNLDNYGTGTDECGTIFCVVGLAAMLPHFQEQGLAWDMDGQKKYEYGTPRLGKVYPWSFNSSMDAIEMFGIKPYYNLFTHRDGSPLDDWYRGSNPSDKQIALARLHAQLAMYKDEE